LDRLRYPMTTGAILLWDVLRNCYTIKNNAHLFSNRFAAYSTIISILWNPTEKIKGIFTRFNENIENVATQVFKDTVPLIMDASNNLYRAFSKAVADKNQTLIERYQNCSDTALSNFQRFSEQFLYKSLPCFNQNVNYARIDELLTDIFSAWSELYSGIAGCCSLAKNIYPSPEPTPPRFAERHLDLDSLAIQCLENVYQKFFSSANYLALITDLFSDVRKNSSLQLRLSQFYIPTNRSKQR
jgi:hypothetical protein